MRGDFRDEARRFEDIDKAQPLPSPLCNWPKCEEWATVTLRNGEKALSPLVSRNFACIEHAADYVACGMVVESVEGQDTALRCVCVHCQQTAPWTDQTSAPKVTHRIETLSGRGLPTGTDADGYDTYEAAEAMADAMHDGEYRIVRSEAR